MRCCAIQLLCSTMLGGAVQCNAAYDSTMLCGAVLCYAMQRRDEQRINNIML